MRGLPLKEVFKCQQRLPICSSGDDTLQLELRDLKVANGARIINRAINSTPTIHGTSIVNTGAIIALRNIVKAGADCS